MKRGKRSPEEIVIRRKNFSHVEYSEDSKHSPKDRFETFRREFIGGSCQKSGRTNHPNHKDGKGIPNFRAYLPFGETC